VSFYRYHCHDLVTGETIGDNLPIQVSSMSRQINSIGTLSGALNLLASPNQVLVQSWVAAIEARRVMLIVFQDEQPIWSGIITGWPHQSILDGTLPITASTPEWLLQYRVISEPQNFSNQDVLDIFSDLLRYAVSKSPNARIAGLQIPSVKSGVLATLSYDTNSLTKVYDALTTLVTTYGFEFSVRPALPPDPEADIYHYVDVGYPQLGSLTGAIFQMPGNLLDYMYVRNGEQFANVIYGTASSGGLALTTVQTNDTDLSAGYPLMEDSVSWSASVYQSDLDAFAAGEIVRRAQSERQPLLTLGEGQAPRVRDISLGDTVVFLGTDVMHPAAAGTGAPGLQAAARVTGWTLYPPGPNQVEQTQYQLMQMTNLSSGPF
jgi:hypothetical protein